MTHKRILPVLGLLALLLGPGALLANTWTQTTDTDFNTGTKNSTLVHDTGSSASVVLLSTMTYVTAPTQVNCGAGATDHGIACDGDFVYMTDGSMVSKYNLDGTLVETKTVSLGGDNQGLAYAGGRLFGRSGANINAYTWGDVSTVSITVPSGKALLSGESWDNSNLGADPQGRIYTLGYSAGGATVRRYTISGNSLVWLDDITLGGTYTSVDNHGITSDGNFLTFISYSSGWRRWNLATGALEIDFSGTSNTQLHPSGMSNPTFTCYNYKTGETYVGDYSFNRFFKFPTQFSTGGTFTSTIYDCTQASTFSTMSWNATTPANTTLTMKVRTGNQANMSDAVDWGSCPAVTSGQDITALSSVSNGSRYIQYQSSLSTTDTATTAKLLDVTINFVPDAVAPASTVTIPADGNNYNAMAIISGAASDNVGGSGVAAVTITIQRLDNNQYWTGSSWGAQTWLTTTGTTSWSYNSSSVSWANAVNYRVKSKAVDVAGNNEIPGTGNAFYFNSAMPVSAVSVPASNYYYSALTTLSGTATVLSGTITQVQVSIKRNSDNLYSNGSGGWGGTETWLTATGTTSWTYSSGAVGWANGSSYVVRSKASTASQNETPSAGTTFYFDTTPPAVTVTYPSASGITVGSLSTAGINAGNTSINVTWSVSDTANPTTFDVAISTNSGTSYTTIATGLANGTTSYSLNTLNYNNGTSLYKIKVTATDQGGLTGSGESANSFSINNENFAPAVTLTYPNGGESLGGNVTVTWTQSDPNTSDHHTFTVQYSIDSGNNYTTLVSSLPDGTASYVWNSTTTPDSVYYKIKVIATDDGAGTGYAPKTGEDASDAIFAVNNVNKPPNSFNLLSPADKSSDPSTTPVLDWETAGDPDPGQVLTYSLLVSDTSNFSHVIISKTGITESYYLVSAADGLTDGQTYYWKVSATDNGTPALTTPSAQTSWSFTVRSGNPAVSQTVPAVDSKTLSGYIPNVRVIFNKRIDQATLVKNNIIFVDQDGAAINFNLSYTEVDKTLTLTPMNPLPPSKSFTITVSSAVKDLAGNALASDFSFTFTTLIETTQGLDYANRDRTLRIVAEANVMPVNSYIKVAEVSSANSTKVKQANDYIVSDPTIKTTSVKIYQLALLDANDQAIASFTGTVQLTMNYPDADNDGYLDGTNVREDLLRLCKLNEATNKWELVSNDTRDLAANSFTVQTGNFGVFAILAFKAPSSTLTGTINYPNPFAAGKESTTIAYTLTKDATVTITIFNLIGDLVRKLEFGAGSEGGKGTDTGYTNRVSWNGRNDDGMIVANGAYICRIVAEASDGSGTFKEIRKIAVIK